MSDKPMRERMPEVTRFIDSLRDAFGKEDIDVSIKRGLEQGTFYAEENGYTVGVNPDIYDGMPEFEWRE